MSKEEAINDLAAIQKLINQVSNVTDANNLYSFLLPPKEDALEQLEIREKEKEIKKQHLIQISKNSTLVQELVSKFDIVE